MEDLDAFAHSQRRGQEQAGVRPRKLGAGLGAQIGLARRESPHRGARALGLGLANILAHEMPHTLAAMTTGRLSEWRATLLARETATLALVAAARRLAYRLDPDSVVRRARRAEHDRTVTIRPAPDTMTYLTALLPGPRRHTTTPPPPGTPTPTYQRHSHAELSVLELAYPA